MEISEEVVVLEATLCACDTWRDVDAEGLKERPESKLIAPLFVRTFLTSSSSFVLFNQ